MGYIWGKLISKLIPFMTLTRLSAVYHNDPCAVTVQHGNERETKENLNLNSFFPLAVMALLGRIMVVLVVKSGCFVNILGRVI